MQNRWHLKADAVVAGWHQYFGSYPPSKRAVGLILSVAQHETWCGDAWPGANNWGAVQWRVPTPDERVRIQDGTLLQGTIIPGGILQKDSSPVGGAYWCWFKAFTTEAEGAEYLVTTLCRPNVMLEIETCSPERLAELMYRNRYYEGVHDPRGAVGADGWTDGQKKNIGDYGSALLKLFYPIMQAIADWEGIPTTKPDPSAQPIPVATEEREVLSAPEE